MPEPFLSWFNLFLALVLVGLNGFFVAAEFALVRVRESRIVEETEGVDPVTQDMVIDILRDEQGHRRLFEGFLREYEAEGLA